jgi:hypothetical protein
VQFLFPRKNRNCHKILFYIEYKKERENQLIPMGGASVGAAASRAPALSTPAK